jgi:pilus assembly protein Flp/PilA
MLQPGGTMKIATHIRRFLNDDSGATAIEYCLIATGIALLLIAAVNGVGTKLKNSFTSVNTQLR